MIGTALAALALLFAVQCLLVVIVADKLTSADERLQQGNMTARPSAGRYAEAA